MLEDLTRQRRNSEHSLKLWSRVSKKKRKGHFVLMNRILIGWNMKVWLPQHLIDCIALYSLMHCAPSSSPEHIVNVPDAAGTQLPPHIINIIIIIIVIIGVITSRPPCQGGPGTWCSCRTCRQERNWGCPWGHGRHRGCEYCVMISQWEVSMTI